MNTPWTFIRRDHISRMPIYSAARSDMEDKPAYDPYRDPWGRTFSQDQRDMEIPAPQFVPFYGPTGLEGWNVVVVSPAGGMVNLRIENR